MIKLYLKSKLKGIFAIIICSGVFSLIFFLQNIPLNAVIYSFFICFILGAIFAIYDFYKFYKKFQTLEIIKNNLSSMIKELPETNDVSEMKYQELISELHSEYSNLSLETSQNKTEMTDFYTLWVHQIKTPISAISLLVQDMDSAECKQISREIFKIQRYTEMVLSYLRIDYISSDLILIKCDIQNILNQVVKKYAPIFIYKNIKLNISPFEANVISDEKWLVYALEQILSNSLKYTNVGEINVSIDKNILSLSDTGIGIAPDDLPRIFEKGFTGFNGRMDKKATGLGLYLCKKTLDKLGHTISITSTPDIGTTVNIDFTQKNIFLE